MIGFVNICHPDYVNKSVHTIVGQAKKTLDVNSIPYFMIQNPVTDYKSAEMAGREIVKQGVDGVIIFLGSWVECSTVFAFIREIEHLPMCLWGFGMFKEGGALTSTGSYVSFAMLKGSMDRAGYHYKPLLGLPSDIETQLKIKSFARASVCSQKLKRLRVGLIGYASMSIYPGTFDHLLMRIKIGPEIVQSDSYTLIENSKKVSDDSCNEAIAHLKSIAHIKPDVQNSMLQKTARIYVALKELCKEQGLNAVNIKCQYEFSKEYKAVPCVPLSALADEGIVSSCEGDVMNTVSMAILNILSGDVVAYGDAMNHMQNVVKFSSCGFAPFSLGEKGCCEIGNFMPHPGFSGLQASFVLKRGRVTIMRLVEDRNDYHILYMTGEGLETELRQGYMPALDVRLDGDIKKLVDNYSGQHYAICYGDLSEEIEDLARILGIRTVRV
ncbi:MAG: hypothetical protein LLF89_02600 [Spirochaetaceae bacterium]|nr:hypothetical protein [Spirochaetaceae bacterium]